LSGTGVIRGTIPPCANFHTVRLGSSWSFLTPPRFSSVYFALFEYPSFSYVDLMLRPSAAFMGCPFFANLRHVPLLFPLQAALSSLTVLQRTPPMMNPEPLDRRSFFGLLPAPIFGNAPVETFTTSCQIVIFLLTHNTICGGSGFRLHSAFVF